ncbi:hypothetical protein D3C87_1793970 [compost metagenome]
MTVGAAVVHPAAAMARPVTIQVDMFTRFIVRNLLALRANRRHQVQAVMPPLCADVDARG